MVMKIMMFTISWSCWTSTNHLQGCQNKVIKKEESLHFVANLCVLHERAVGAENVGFHGSTKDWHPGICHAHFLKIVKEKEVLVLPQVNLIIIISKKISDINSKQPETLYIYIWHVRGLSLSLLDDI